MYTKISSLLDIVANKLESKGLLKEAFELDRIADVIDKEANLIDGFKRGMRGVVNIVRRIPSAGSIYNFIKDKAPQEAVKFLSDQLGKVSEEEFAQIKKLALDPNFSSREASNKILLGAILLTLLSGISGKAVAQADYNEFSRGRQESLQRELTTRVVYVKPRREATDRERAAVLDSLMNEDIRQLTEVIAPLVHIEYSDASDPEFQGGEYRVRFQPSTGGSIETFFRYSTGITERLAQDIEEQIINNGVKGKGWAIGALSSAVFNAISNNPEQREILWRALDEGGIDRELFIKMVRRDIERMF